MKKLTNTQAAALKNLAAGRPSAWGLHGRSQMGGHSRTMVSLWRIGMVDDHHEITQAGREAIQSTKGRD